MSILFLPGTLLVHTDLQLLEGALHPTMTGIESKGIASVKSPVQNISEHTRIDLDLLHHTLASSFVQQYSENARGSNVHLVRVDPDALVRQSSLLASMRATMASWEWIFAGGPVFSYAAPLQLRRSTLAPAGHAHRASGTLNFRVLFGNLVGETMWLTARKTARVSNLKCFL
eukprot:m.555335 g.555335  ORF g.555335 m.555335 type:complete len:172 (-) comp22181_c0_seq25:453-968(-)